MTTKKKIGEYYPIKKFMPLLKKAHYNRDNKVK
jgi:hypothetical protein